MELAASGAGLLLVDGDVAIASGVRWTGMLVVLGRCGAVDRRGGRRTPCVRAAESEWPRPRPSEDRFARPLPPSRPPPRWPVPSQRPSARGWCPCHLPRGRAMAFRASRRKTSAGLDVGSGFVKLVLVDHAGDLPEVVGVSVRPVPEGAIVDGEVVDREPVAGTVREAIHEVGAKSSVVVAALGGHDVFVKRVGMPRMKESDARSAVPMEAKRHVPFDLAGVHLDFEILPRPPHGDGTGLEGGPADPEEEMDVLITAAKQERIEEKVALLAAAGVRASGDGCRGLCPLQRPSAQPPQLHRGSCRANRHWALDDQHRRARGRGAHPLEEPAAGIAHRRRVATARVWPLRPGGRERASGSPPHSGRARGRDGRGGNWHQAGVGLPHGPRVRRWYRQDLSERRRSVHPRTRAGARRERQDRDEEGQPIRALHAARKMRRPIRSSTVRFRCWSSPSVSRSGPSSSPWTNLPRHSSGAASPLDRFARMSTL